MSYKKNKFLTDYEVHEFVKPNGKIGSVTTYIGEYYVFTHPGHKRAALFMLAAFIISAACFVTAISFANQCFFYWYVTAPYFFQILAYWFMGCSIYYMVFMKEPYQRYYADYIMMKYPPAAMGMLVCSLIPCAAAAILLAKGIIRTDNTGNIIFLAMSAVQTAAAAWLFFSRHKNDLFVQA